MQYSPKLKIAMEQIKSVLKEHDIAGIVVIHTPGFSEFLFEVSPSYSCAKIADGRLNVKTNPADSEDIKKQVVTDTYNMFTHFSDVGGPIVVNCMDAVGMMEKSVEVISKTGGGHTSHEQQNN